MTSHEIRAAYLDFMREKGHAVIPSASLLPENDPTTLFTGSGMQPMIGYLLGEKHPLGTRIADSQKCFRAVDIDEVGDNRHTTFFEMLGNWSLGDYFKKEQISWMFEFLTEKLGLDPTRLYVTCFAGNEEFGIARDDEAAGLWRDLFASKGVEATIGETPEKDGMRPGERIFFYPDKKNWWSRAGVPAKMPVGEPGGPDTEMFWDFGEQLGLHAQSPWRDEPCHVNCDCGRFMEIGNNVFMEYIRTETGFEKLKQQNVDFGGGLERMAVAVRDVADVFQSALFDGLRGKLEELTGKTYGADETETGAFRVIMDHLRGATFLIADGALPGNVDAGYFTRRLIRRAVRAGRKLGLADNFTADVADVVIAEYRETYPDLAAQAEKIRTALFDEETKFRRTLERGEREIEKLLTAGPIDGAKGFWLFETYGFPREMTEEVMLETVYPDTKTYANIEIAREHAFADKPELKLQFESFAAEFKAAAAHHAEMSRTAAAGKFKGGLADHSEETTALHTAAHLMLEGLRRTLGLHVEQRGSNITAERLRFDFCHDKPLTEEEITAVEQFVNAAIAANATQTMVELPKEEARESGATGMFWEKYPELVKVYAFQSADGAIWSREICGGPHVPSTGGMGRFKIQKQESSGSGIRRIKAVLEK